MYAFARCYYSKWLTLHWSIHFFQFMHSSEIKPITLLMLVSFAQVTKSVCMVYTVAANESCDTCMIEQTNKWSTWNKQHLCYFEHVVNVMAAVYWRCNLSLVSRLDWKRPPSVITINGVHGIWIQHSPAKRVWWIHLCLLLDICTLILDFHQASGLKGQAVRHKFSKLCIFSHWSQWILILLNSASSGLHAQYEAVILTVIMLKLQVHRTAV